MQEDAVVYIVHTIDTEGPLYESLAATFERLSNSFGIVLEPTYENLNTLRNREMDLGGKEAVVAQFLSPELLRYNDTWDKIDTMLAKVMSPEYRNVLPDSFGNQWVYNWCCVDHIGYEVNPRSKDMGYHNIHDRYVAFLDKYKSGSIDDLQWHFHPMSMYREAHRFATSYENSFHLHQVLCRRIIERNFFPSVFRAGFHVERPDSHWFLEQWIPFDCSNLSLEDNADVELQDDFQGGRFFDWRRAPTDWTVYQPDFYDYQIPGNCNRYIARSLQMNTRMANLTQEETDKAFENALKGKKVLLGVNNHDYRDMSVDIDIVRDKISRAAARFPEVKFKYCRAKDAFNQICHQGHYENIELDVSVKREDKRIKLGVKTIKGKVFGPQPYLAIQTRDGRFIHDNFAFGLDKKSWFYIFDKESIHHDDIKKIGIAANNKYGDTFTKVIPFDV